MRSFDKFKWKMNLSGGSLRNENVKNSKELLEATFEDDASFVYGIYFWELGVKDYSDREQLRIRLYKRTFSAAQGITVKFQTPADLPVVVGDIIYDSNKDKYLICTESFDLDGIHWYGKFTLCNWMLRWQKQDGEILEYPCYDMNTTQYNSGEQSNRQFTIGSTQHMLTLPYDENTVALRSPQRFFLDKDTENPTSFIVTQNDNTSYNYGDKGLVKVTVMETANNDVTDRFDLGICDYITPEDAALDNSHNPFVMNAAKSVISFDTNIITSGGDPRMFVAKFFDEYGNEVLGIEPLWTISCDFKDALMIEDADDYISIGIDDDEYVDEEFKLTLSDSEGRYRSSQIVRVESLL